MTPKQARLVAESFALLEGRLPDLGAAVYERLFRYAPQTRSMFKGDMAEQHKKLVNVIVEFVKLRRRSQHFLPVTGNRGEAVVPGINRLRAGHKVAGVQNGHYALMRRAILESLREFLGDRFDLANAEAWGAAFDMLAETMQKPEHATPEERNLLSRIFGRKIQAANNSEVPVRGGAMDDFFGRRVGA